MRWALIVGVCIIASLSPGGLVGAVAEPIAPLLQTLRGVEREAQGNRAATVAWKDLTARAGADQLPAILTAIDGASPLGANWLRSAVDAIAERELNRGMLPTAGLQTFLAQHEHDPRARRLAYEWIVRADPNARERLAPTFLDDPSLELRRDAVAGVLITAQEAVAQQKTEVAKLEFGRALTAARDLDQVKLAADALEKLGHPVDLAHHYGFLQDWQLVGPFDNQAGKGFDVAYPPEKSFDRAANYETPGGTLHWVAHHTEDAAGQVDLNQALGKHMGAAAYCVAEFQCDAQRPVELRLGTESANKIWLNGKLLSWAEVYHANGTMDQYVGRGTLRAGRNIILLKICQNEQTETWAQDWKFQLRACDSSGKAILATDRPGPRMAASPDASAAKQSAPE